MCDYNPNAPMPKQPERQYKVGDKVSVTLHSGRIVDATVRAIIERTDGKRLQVDYGKDETALVTEICTSSDRASRWDPN